MYLLMQGLHLNLPIYCGMRAPGKEILEIPLA